jgi:osmotically-inducible protein OsmY
MIVVRRLVGDVEKNLRAESVADSPVLTALTSDPRIEISVSEVIEERGIVTLSGHVDRVEILRAAIEIAKAQPGVLQVINGLSVTEDQFSSGFVTHYTKTQLTP